MPIDTRVRDYVAGSRDACRAVVAAREQGERAPRPGAAAALRVAHFSGEQIDRAETIEAPPSEAGIAGGELQRMLGADGVRRRSRPTSTPLAGRTPAARVLDAKLANWSGAGATPARATRSTVSPTG